MMLSHRHHDVNVRADQRETYSPFPAPAAAVAAGVLFSSSLVNADEAGPFRYYFSVSATGRNDPCPCGSGRKYKQCCLRAADVVDAAWYRLRDAEGRLMPKLLRLTLDAWGKDGFQEAVDRFYHDAPCADLVADDREFESLFATWSAFTFAPESPGERSGLPAALLYLKETPDVPDFDRRYLLTAAASPVSFHAVTAVNPGRTIDLEDVLTGATCQVVERTASQTVRVGGVLFARTLTMDGVSILFGMGSTQLPPARRSDLMPLRDRVAGRGKRLTRDEVAALDDPLRHWYLHAADQEHHPRLPTLVNTDGDPLALTTLHFELRCTPEEAFAALRPLDVVSPSDEDVLEEAERDGSGRLTSFTFHWMKRGNKKHKSWDNTRLGRIVVRGAEMTAEVNSNKRAARLKREVARRLGDRAAYVRAVIESTEHLLEQARAGKGGPPRETDPALRELEAALQEQHWTAWLDESVPALGGKTPRQAARSREGREMLNALLADFEWRGGAPVSRLRAALKL